MASIAPRFYLHQKAAAYISFVMKNIGLVSTYALVKETALVSIYIFIV